VLSQQRGPHPTAAAVPRAEGRTAAGSRRWHALLSAVPAYAILIGATIVLMLPYVIVLSTSFKRTFEMVGADNFRLFANATFENYSQLFTTSLFGRWMLNSVVVSVGATGVVLLVDSLAGYVFARREFPGRRLLFGLLLATLMVPTSVTLIPLFMVVIHVGLADSYFGIVAPYVSGPFGVFLMRQFMLTIPRELEDAAQIDGCGAFGIYWRIILPISSPALSVLGIVTFINVWTDFLWPLIITSSDTMKTMPVGMASSMGLHVTPWGLISAGVIVSILPLAVMFLWFQNLFIEGITRGALKG
jgi:ABC-type glycerol-3-phosphate transport system permease component